MHLRRRIDVDRIYPTPTKKILLPSGAIMMIAAEIIQASPLIRVDDRVLELAVFPPTVHHFNSFVLSML